MGQLRNPGPLSREAARPGPFRAGRAHAGGWSWERYATELNIPPERIKVGQRLVADILAAAGDRGLPWQVVMSKGYVAIQRPGGYNVLVVDLWWNRVPRLAGKIPAEPASPRAGQPVSRIFPKCGHRPSANGAGPWPPERPCLTWAR